MLTFKKIRWRNLLSTGNTFTEIELDKTTNALIIGNNGAGKCLHKSTQVDIQFKDKETEKKFKKYMKTRKTNKAIASSV